MILKDPVKDDTASSVAIGFDRAAHSNMSSILFDNLARNPDRIAIYSETATFSYLELCALAARAGHGFSALGLSKGDRILILLDDRAEYVAAFFGAVRIGLVPVLINTASPADQIGYFLEDSAAPLMLVEAGLLDNMGDAIANADPLKTIIVVGGISDLPTQCAKVDWNDFISGHKDQLEPAQTDPNDMAFWMYSSGSTGRPKGVVHLHHDAVYTDLSYGQSVLKLERGDIAYSVPKIFFAYGFGNSITFPFSAGAAVVLATGRPDPDRVFNIIERFKPTVFFGLPTLYNALIAHAEERMRDLTSIRLCVSAAEILPEETFNTWRDRYGLEIVEGLGSTELLHIYISNRPGDYRLGSAGKAVDGYEIELRDQDGAPAHGDGSGIMWVRGHSSAVTYWNRPEATRDTMRDDWIYTGDRFDRDEDGFYYFLGRADDLIKVSGQWIYPLEIEHCLGDHPDIVDCAVLGLSKENGLMTTKAFVELKAGQSPSPELTKDLQKFVKERLLPYKYPREIEYIAELPKTGTGKVDRHKLKLDHETHLARS